MVVVQLLNFSCSLQYTNRAEWEFSHRILKEQGISNNGALTRAEHFGLTVIQTYGHICLKIHIRSHWNSPTSLEETSLSVFISTFTNFGLYIRQIIINFMGRSLPSDTQAFLEQLYDYLYARDSEGVRRLYEVEFRAITANHYATTNWPGIDEVMEFYKAQGKAHHLVYILYQVSRVMRLDYVFQELYFRHSFSNMSNQITWQNRQNSWQNYTFLFSFLLENECCEE